MSCFFLFLVQIPIFHTLTAFILYVKLFCLEFCSQICVDTSFAILILCNLSALLIPLLNFSHFLQEISHRPTERTPMIASRASSDVSFSGSGNSGAIGFGGALQIPGVVEFSLCLFFSKLVSYTFLYWLPNYIEHTSKLILC